MPYSYGTIGGPPGAMPKDNTQSFGGGGYGGVSGPDRIGPPTGLGVPPTTIQPGGPKPFDLNDPSTWSDEQRQMMYSQMYSATGGYAGGSSSASYDPVQGSYGPAPTGPTGGASPGAGAPAMGTMPDSPQGLYALPGYEDFTNYLKQRLGDINGRQDSSFRAGQMGLADQLQKYANGTESVSQLQLKQAADANIANQMAMAAGARPGQGAMMSRMASQNAGSIGTQLAGQQAVAGLQERQQASNALAGLYNTGRSQDLQGQAQGDAAINNTLAALLQGSALQQHGGISQATNALQAALAAMGKPGTGTQILGSLAPALPWIGSLIKGDGSTPTPTADPSYGGYGSAPY